MMKYIKHSFRVIKRYKVYTCINLVGLIISMASVLIITRYIYRELTVDHLCPLLERTFVMTVVHENNKISLYNSEDINKDPNYKNPLSDPSVETVTRFHLVADDYIIMKDSRYIVQTIAVDTSFLQMMPYPLLLGKKNITLPNETIITSKLAIRLFGTQDPLGKSIKSSSGKILTVVGVVGEPKTKSSFVFDIIVSRFLVDNWSVTAHELVQLNRAEKSEKLNKKNAVPMRLKMYGDRPIYYKMIPLQGFYFNKQVNSGDYKNILQGNRAGLDILLLVVALLVLVGLLNYVNLYTAVVQNRSREFGIKKVYGSGSFRLFSQLYLENFCLSFIALFFIWLLVEATQGLMSGWFGITVVSDLFYDICFSLGFLFLFPFIITLFPFINYNYRNPAISLRSGGDVKGGKQISRIVFLLIQNVITSGLVLVALYFNFQLAYMLNMDLNYNTKDIIQCRFFEEYPIYNETMTLQEWNNREKKKKEQIAFVEKEINESPLFTSWTNGHFINNIVFPFTFLLPDGTKKECMTTYAPRSYMQLFGFKLKEGRSFIQQDDEDCSYHVIINESAKKLLGIHDIRKDVIQPENRLQFGFGVDKSLNPPYEVIGVIEDFRVGHLSQPDQPLVLLNAESGREEPFLAAIVPGKRKEAIAFLENLSRKILGDGDFEYTFLEDELQKIYHEDKLMVRTYTTFSVIAILVSCFGLFGISLYDIRRRYREIALRKINGASFCRIYSLLMWKYIWVLTVAFCISSILATLFIEKYMEGYAHRVSLLWWMYFAAAGLNLIVSFCTLWWQFNKAVKIDPARILKTE